MILPSNYNIGRTRGGVAVKVLASQLTMSPVELGVVCEYRFVSSCALRGFLRQFCGFPPSAKINLSLIHI